METLFFLLLFVRNCRVPRCSNSKLSLSIPSFVQSKKVGRDMTLTSADDLTLHAKLLHWVPVISSPKPFINQLWRSTIHFQRLLAKLHIMESLLTECRKSTKDSFQASCSGLQGSKKKKITGTKALKDRPRARTPSTGGAQRLLSEPCFLSCAIYSCQGDT